MAVALPRLVRHCRTSWMPWLSTCATSPRRWTTTADSTSKSGSTQRNSTEPPTSPVDGQKGCGPERSIRLDRATFTGARTVAGPTGENPQKRGSKATASGPGKRRVWSVCRTLKSGDKRAEKAPNRLTSAPRPNGRLHWLVGPWWLSVKIFKISFVR